MFYLANPSKGPVAAAMAAGLIGCITSPKQGNRIPAGSWWCADNGKYGKGWPGEDKWWAWVQKMVKDYGPAKCLFVTAPDVVADHEATMAASRPWMAKVRSLHVPVAFVAQNGAETSSVPWREFDVLFIGGDTEWKLTKGLELGHEAKKRGKQVHVGRVNSKKRFHLAESWGGDTCDGTYLTYGPNINLPKLLSWGAAPRQTDVFEQIRRVDTE